MATVLCPVLIAQEGGEACARGATQEGGEASARGATPPVSLLISKSLLFL